MTVTDGRQQATIRVVLDGLTSDNARRAYAVALREFIGWCVNTGQTRLDKVTVEAYKTKLQDDGLAPSSVNLSNCQWCASSPAKPPITG